MAEIIDIGERALRLQIDRFYALRDRLADLDDDIRPEFEAKLDHLWAEIQQAVSREW